MLKYQITCTFFILGLYYLYSKGQLKGILGHLNTILRISQKIIIIVLHHKLFLRGGRMQFCRKTMLLLQSIGMSIDCKAFLMKYVLNCSSLSLFSNKPRLKSVHLRLQQSDGPHFQKGRPSKKAQTRKKIAFATSLLKRASAVVIAVRG